MTNSYVYIESESGSTHKLFTVGFYSPNGIWHPESDHVTAKEAANRVHWLNGGKPYPPKENRLEKLGKLSDKEYSKLGPRQLDELGDDEH